MLTYVPPTLSHNHLYSFSGSITMVGIPNKRYLRISSFTENDLPEPDVASTMLFALGSFPLNLSNITRDPVCSFAQYRIPVCSIRSFAMKGNDHESELVTMLLVIPKSSTPNGIVLMNHSSIRCVAGFTLIPYHETFCSYFFPSSLIFSLSGE